MRSQNPASIMNYSIRISNCLKLNRGWHGNGQSKIDLTRTGYREKQHSEGRSIIFYNYLVGGKDSGGIKTGY